MKTWTNWLGGMLIAGRLLAADPQPLFQTDFQQAAVGKVPDGMMVLDGGWAVQEEGGNRFLELPGAPLDSYALLFGPAQKDGVTLSARVFGTGKGRRYPTFGISLGGASGYRLQVSPGRKALELIKGENVQASRTFEWPSGKWTHLKLEIRKVKDGAWKITGKAWPEGTTEPAEWNLSSDDSEEPRLGRPGVFGSPFAGTPIRYDDLVFRAAP